jgi:hypothetical protein
MEWCPRWMIAFWLALVLAAGVIVYNPGYLVADFYRWLSILAIALFSGLFWLAICARVADARRRAWEGDIDEQTVAYIPSLASVMLDPIGLDSNSTLGSNSSPSAENYQAYPNARGKERCTEEGKGYLRFGIVVENDNTEAKGLAGHMVFVTDEDITLARCYKFSLADQESKYPGAFVWEGPTILLPEEIVTMDGGANDRQM